MLQQDPPVLDQVDWYNVRKMAVIVVVVVTECLCVMLVYCGSMVLVSGVRITSVHISWGPDPPMKRKTSL